MDLPNAAAAAANNTSFTDKDPNTPSSDQQQSPPNNAANGHLVYVRRKPEAEMPKNTAFDSATLNVSCQLSTQLYCDEEIAPPKPHIKDSTPIPVSLAPLDSNHVPPSIGHTIANPNVFTNLHWEDRYQQLHIFLRKLDQSDQADYIQMLHSLSSVELSRHAVELEKRSIQLSLEEAKELQRVAALNVLGKSVKNFKAPADHGECSDKLKTLT